jgi:CBS domain-containing protein
MRQITELVKHQNPLTMPPHTTVQDACLRMQERRVGAVLVTETERLVGIFTARDAVCRVLANGKSPAETTLAEVMTRDPASLQTGCTAIEALRLMQERKLLGVVSKGDFSGQEYGRLEEETILWERIG